jgi:antirestriction protein ArdC
MNKTEIYDRITTKLFSKIEAGVIPWRRSWNVGIPRNYISKHAYNGINFLSLLTEDHPSPYYLTFLQAKEKGTTINKGESGSLIVFWKIHQIENEEQLTARIPFIRYSYAFNLCQTSLYNANTETNSITTAEELISRMQNLPLLKHNYHRCAYSLIDDYITLPTINDFDSPAEYYSSFFMKRFTVLDTVNVWIELLSLITKNSILKRS